MSTQQETEQVLRNLERRRREAARKRRRTKRILIAVCVIIGILLLLFGIAYGVFHHYYSMMNIDRDNTIPSVLGTIDPDDDVDPNATNSDEDTIKEIENNIQGNVGKNDIVFDGDVYNLLLIGTDARDLENERGRSDSMIIFSVNKKLKTITMTSVMRDIYLHIPEAGNNRVNAAYAYGGAPLLVSTLEENFGIHIDNYMIANFAVFKDIVDVVGGVDIEISQAEIDVMNGYIEEYNQKISGESLDTDKLSYSDAGMAHLNGKQALSYCRVRYVGNGDFDRTGRQREVMDKIISKCKTLSVSELNELAETVLPWLTTDLSASNALSLAFSAISNGYYNYDLQSLRLPADNTWYDAMISGMSVLSIDFDENRDLFFETVYGKSYAELSAE